MSYLDGINDIWQSAKESFRSTLAQSVIDLWFGDLKIISFDDSKVTFSTDSEFKHKIIKEKSTDKFKKAKTSLTKNTSYQHCFFSS